MAESHTLPEGGLLIVTLPDQGAVGPLRSHYFDPRAAQGKIRDALVKWFKIWGIALSGSTKNPTWLERHTTEVVWCDSIPAELHGPQTVKHFIQTGEKVAQVIEETRPKVILVLSAYLYEAMASDALAPRISAVIGKALYPPRRITTMRLKALEQRFEHAQILVLPTPSKNTTEEYVRSLSASVREAFERAGFDLNATGDALIQAILTERLHELPLEFRVWDDIRRTRLYPEADGTQSGTLKWVALASADIQNKPDGQIREGAIPEFALLFPIPLDEMQRNPALNGHQNPGWR